MYIPYIYIYEEMALRLRKKTRTSTVFTQIAIYFIAGAHRNIHISPLAERCFVFQKTSEEHHFALYVQCANKTTTTSIQQSPFADESAICLCVAENTCWFRRKQHLKGGFVC